MGDGTGVNEGIGVLLGTKVELGRNVMVGCGVKLICTSMSTESGELVVLLSIIMVGSTSPNSASATDSPTQPLNIRAPMQRIIKIGLENFCMV